MIVRALAFFAIVLAAAGCATTDNRVVLREFEQSSNRATRPLAKIAIVTIDADAARRKAWDDAFAVRLASAGVPVTTRDGLPGARRIPVDAALLGVGVRFGEERGVARRQRAAQVLRQLLPVLHRELPADALRQQVPVQRGGDQALVHGAVLLSAVSPA